MDELEKLKLRLARLNKWYESLPQEERWNSDGGHHSTTTLSSVVGEEFSRIERRIAEIRMKEVLDIDENFEKEVLSDHRNR